MYVMPPTFFFSIFGVKIVRRKQSHQAD